MCVGVWVWVWVCVEVGGADEEEEGDFAIGAPDGLLEEGPCVCVCVCGLGGGRRGLPGLVLM